jgi:hypothetical protein
MRSLGLAFLACLALGACAKKQPPAKAPAAPAAEPAPAAPPDSQPMERKGDPCEGGEKPK